jgi:large repetitive protein
VRARAVASVAVLLLVVIAGGSPAGAAPGVSGPTTVTGPAARDTPDAAFDGTNWLVVWSQPTAENGEDVYGRRIGGDGAALGGAFPIATSPGDDSKPAVASNGSSFLVVWQHLFDAGNWDINARQVSTSGAVNPDLYSVAFGDHSEEAPDIAASGTNYLVAWQDDRAPANGWDIWASGRQPTGGNLGQFHVGGEDNGRHDTEPAVAWNGSQFLVVWQHAYQSTTVSDVWGTRTTISGAVDFFDFIVSDVMFRDDAPAVASNGSEWFVVWGRKGTGAYDLRGERITDGGIQQGEFDISTAAGDQDTPSVAFTGSYLVAWHDRRSSSVPDIYGGRVTSAGAVADGSGFPIAATSDTEDSPAVTGGPGGGWGVVLESGTGGSTTVALRRVSAK